MRLPKKPEEFADAADELDNVVVILRNVVGGMKKHGLPVVLVHGDTTMKHHLPAMVDWAFKLEAEYNSQLRAFQAGKQSRAEFNKQKHETEKTKKKGRKS